MKCLKRLVIEGGHLLQGKVSIQGAKNAAQKILPATIVFPGTYVINNVPRIEDSRALLNILHFLGAQVEFLDPTTVHINTERVVTKEIPPEVTATSTGTFLFAGALLSRFGEVRIWHPGGDRIGKRPVTWHLAAFEKLGASVIEKPAYYEVRAAKLRGNCSIPFARPTANGTVNAVIAAARADGEVLLENVAPEPEIANFIEFMQAIGVDVVWVDDHALRIHGSQQDHSSGEIDIIPDRNDAATFLLAAVLGHGPVTLAPLQTNHLLPLLDVLKMVGAQMEVSSYGSNQSLTVQCEELRATDLHLMSRPYPGFSTDWGPMMQVLLSQVPGTSRFHETIFSQRFAQVEELIKMGAEIHFLDLAAEEHLYNFDPIPGLFHAIEIRGPRKLTGTLVHANDVRAGAALVLAGLVAEGTTEVTGVEQIERGYECFTERLSSVGAFIQQVTT